MGDSSCIGNTSSARILFLLPLVSCLLFPLTFAICYGVSVHNGNVESPALDGFFPYISEAGTEPPESCIFGQLLNIAAVTCGLTVYLRYRQMQLSLDHYIPEEATTPHRVNYAALVLGMAGAFGVSMVGNFQFNNLRSIHYIGAGVAFGLGLIVSWLQVYLSYVSLRFMCTKPVFYLRIIVSIISSIFVIGTLVPGIIFKITSDQRWRLFSTISEWIMALSTTMMFASFSSEFKEVKVQKPRVSLRHINKSQECENQRY